MARETKSEIVNMSKKNKKITEPEKNYYKLNTAAVDRLANANSKNVKKVSDEELNKYNGSILKRVPIWAKALFIKFWFAGAVCFFFYWGLATYMNSWLDQMFVLGMGMGIVTDILTNNVLRFISSADKEYYPYMMFKSSKYWTFVANIAYAYLLLFLTICIYRVIGIQVEPIIFGIVYTGLDMALIKLKDYVINLLLTKAQSKS